MTNTQQDLNRYGNPKVANFDKFLNAIESVFNDPDNNIIVDFKCKVIPKQTTNTRASFEGLICLAFGITEGATFQGRCIMANVLGFGGKDEPFVSDRLLYWASDNIVAFKSKHGGALFEKARAFNCTNKTISTEAIFNWLVDVRNRLPEEKQHRLYNNKYLIPYQKDHILRGRSSDPNYANIDHLPPDLYNGEQMRWISLGMGASTNYAKINDLLPNKYTALQMKIISLGRGTDERYANIDNLPPNLYSGEQMYLISRCRAEKTYFITLDDLCPKKYPALKMSAIKKGRSNDNRYANIDDLNPLEHTPDSMTKISIERAILFKYQNTVIKHQSKNNFIKA